MYYLLSSHVGIYNLVLSLNDLFLDISTLTFTGNFTQLYTIFHLLDSTYLLVFKEVLSSVLFVIYCDVLFVIYCDAL